MKRKPKLSIVHDPPAHADWVKHDRLAERLEVAARKADLIASALQGVMALKGTNEVWFIQDAAYELKEALEVIARDVRS